YHGDLRQVHRRNRAWRSKRRLCVEQLSGARAPTRCLQTRRNQRELLGLTYRIGLMAIAPPRVSDGEGSSTRSDVAPKCCRCYVTNSSALMSQPPPVSGPTLYLAPNWRCPAEAPLRSDRRGAAQANAVGRHDIRLGVSRHGRVDEQHVTTRPDADRVSRDQAALQADLSVVPIDAAIAIAHRNVIEDDSIAEDAGMHGSGDRPAASSDLAEGNGAQRVGGPAAWLGADEAVLPAAKREPAEIQRGAPGEDDGGTVAEEATGEPRTVE